MRHQARLSLSPHDSPLDRLRRAGRKQVNICNKLKRTHDSGHDKRRDVKLLESEKICSGVSTPPTPTRLCILKLATLRGVALEPTVALIIPTIN